MLDLAPIGKMRQTVPIPPVIVSRDFGLHPPANEYRLWRRSVLAAGYYRARGLFRAMTAQVAVQYWEKLR
jgi:hypothetical protein